MQWNIFLERISEFVEFGADTYHLDLADINVGQLDLGRCLRFSEFHSSCAM